MQEVKRAFTHASRAVDMDCIQFRQEVLDEESNETRFAKIKPDLCQDPETHVIYARVLMQYQGVEAAISYLQELLSEYKYVNEFRLGLSKILLEDDRYQEAENSLAILLAREPKHKEALLLLGQAQQSQGRLDEALQAFLTAATLDPSDADALFKAGLLYLDKNQPALAEAQFRRVLRINKYYPKAHYFIGRAALWKSRWSSAVSPPLWHLRSESVTASHSLYSKVSLP